MLEEWGMLYIYISGDRTHLTPQSNLDHINMQTSSILSALFFVFIGVGAVEVEENHTLEKRGLVDPGLYGASGQGIPVQTLEYINTIPVIRALPVAQPVPVPLPIHVPEPIPVHVPVEVPVYKTVKIPIEKPVPYTVEKPYPVEIIEKVPVPIPKPYPVPYTILKTKHHFKHVITPNHWW